MAVRFDALIDALQNAVIQARRATEQQHLDLFGQYFDEDESGDLRPRSLSLRLPSVDTAGGEDRLEVPILSLVPLSTIQIDEIEISFETKLSHLDDAQDEGDAAQEKTARGTARRKSARLVVDLKKSTFMSSAATANVKVKFTTVEMPEGVARVNDRITKALP